jgi:hypothetical protein
MAHVPAGKVAQMRGARQRWRAQMTELRDALVTVHGYDARHLDSDVAVVRAAAACIWATQVLLPLQRQPTLASPYPSSSSSSDEEEE